MIIYRVFAAQMRAVQGTYALVYGPSFGAPASAPAVSIVLFGGFTDLADSIYTKQLVA